jgi:hypothetical protein
MAGCSHDNPSGLDFHDITLILSFPAQDSNRLKLRKTAFELAYGIPFHLLQPIVRGLPDKFQIVLNRRASVLEMTSWNKKADRAGKIKDKVDTIIKAWHDNAPDLFH